VGAVEVVHCNRAHISPTSQHRAGKCAGLALQTCNLLVGNDKVLICGSLLRNVTGVLGKVAFLQVLATKGELGCRTDY
jgi:hypothetical protein